MKKKTNHMFHTCNPKLVLTVNFRLSKAIERRLLGLALASVMKAQIIDFNLRALMGIAPLF